ncbi:hypothetical protein SUNI508_01120 [Seiridium unicorne]|uniref:UBC core domain-containing protein n=1 Tax=Seiridium unicorne TaxID=138068 RepID=A0ABR2UXJ1_9PEZI
MRSPFKSALERFSGTRGASQREHQDLHHHHQHHEHANNNCFLPSNTEPNHEPSIFGPFNCLPPTRASKKGLNSITPTTSSTTPSVSTMAAKPKRSRWEVPPSASTSHSTPGNQNVGNNWSNPIDLTTSSQSNLANITNAFSGQTHPTTEGFTPNLSLDRHGTPSVLNTLALPNGQNFSFGSFDPSSSTTDFQPTTSMTMSGTDFTNWTSQSPWANASTSTHGHAGNSSPNFVFQPPESWPDVDFEDHAFQEWKEQEQQAEEDAQFARHLQMQFDQEAIAGGELSQTSGSAAFDNFVAPLHSSGKLPADGLTKMEIDSPIPLLTSSANVSNEDEEDEAQISGKEKMDLEQLRQYTRSLSVPCAGCGKKHTLRQEDIPRMTRKWASSSGKILCGLGCSSNSFCSTVTCPGCKSAIRTENGFSGAQPLNAHRSLQSSSSTTVGGLPPSMQYCCEGGREFALWALACGWDQPPTTSFRQTVANKLRPRRSQPGHFASNGARKVSPTKSNIRSPQRERLFHKIPVTPKGTGYGGNATPAAYMPVSRHKVLKPSAVVVSHNTKEDSVQEAYFRLISALLPTISSSEPKALDASPPLYLSTMLARSPLMARAAILLSNDSIQDISRQRTLYDGVLDFVNSLGNHVATSSLVYEDRRLFTQWGMTLPISFGKEEKRKVTAKDISKSLASLVSRLATQGKIMLQHAKQNPQEFEAKAESDLLAWVERVVASSAVHEMNRQHLKADAMEIDGGKGKMTAAAEWTKYHQDYALQELEDEEILKNHHFSGPARTMKAPPKGRMKSLITEVTNLRTSLPEGIFVRHGSSRLDVIKVLIIGPRGTPYEYGFFEFDLFCPLEYPAVPPSVQFKTTGGGKIRFNPNLYENGKVCLSLLGTWQGEPWQPGKSTLLQLLVSIQSMILCENPYYNEPGFENQANQAHNTAYNNKTRASTIHREIDAASRAAAAESKNVQLEHQARNIHAALEKQRYLAALVWQYPGHFEPQKRKQLCIHCKTSKSTFEVTYPAENFEYDFSKGVADAWLATPMPGQGHTSLQPVPGRWQAMQGHQHAQGKDPKVRDVKVMITGMDIFNGKKHGGGGLELPAPGYVADGYLILFGKEIGDEKSDVRLPEGEVDGRIEKKFGNGADSRVKVTVLSAMGLQVAVDVTDINI